MIPAITKSHPVNCVEPCCVRFDDHPTAELVAQAERERFMVFAFFHVDEVPDGMKGAEIADWWMAKHGITPSNYLSVSMVMPPLTVERAKTEMREHLASLSPTDIGPLPPNPEVAA
jgi:hypothetical protein